MQGRGGSRQITLRLDCGTMSGAANTGAPLTVSHTTRVPSLAALTSLIPEHAKARVATPVVWLSKSAHGTSHINNEANPRGDNRRCVQQQG